MNNNKKLLIIGLEPDMWFQILESLKCMLTGYENAIEHPDYKPEIKFEHEYIYLKTIVETLERKLLSE
jgi:hypothetical protein